MSVESVENRVNQETIFGIIPILRHERIYDFLTTFLVTGGYAIATWCYSQGAYISAIIPFAQSITNILGSALIAGLLVYFAVVISTRNGIDMWIYLRAVFGYNCVLIVCFLTMGASFGFDAINAQIFGSSMTLLASSMGIKVSPVVTTLLSLLCILIGVWIAIKGPVAVSWATRIMVPCLIGVGIFIACLVFSNYSLAELSAMVPIDAGAYAPDTAYVVALEWNISFIFSWFCVLGVIARLVKSERASYWGHLGGYSILMALFICIGAMTGLAMTAETGALSVDPTEWLIHLAGPKLAVLSLVFVGFANITTAAVSFYSVSVSTKIVNPELNYKTVAIVWACFCGLLVIWNGIWTYYGVFLAIIACINSPAIALYLTDHYLIRKGKFSFRSIFRRQGCHSYQYTGGFNLVAISCFFLGIVSFLWVYDPINFVPKQQIFMFTTATGFAFLVTGISYYILSKIPYLRGYLLKDQHENPDKNVKGKDVV